jgi:murein DD-endopeptidase MepM/ murein hydrolase activator NlpD
MSNPFAALRRVHRSVYVLAAVLAVILLVRAVIPAGALGPATESARRSVFTWVPSYAPPTPVARPTATLFPRLAQAQAEATAKPSTPPEGDDDVIAIPPRPVDAPLPGVPGFRPSWPSSPFLTSRFREVGPTSPGGHAGIDLAADQGMAVFSAEAGTVGRAGFDNNGYGNLITINHAAGFETWYGHLSAINIRAGQQVARGELIGRVGSTGFSTGPHLHFEVRENGQQRDPLAYLP